MPKKTGPARRAGAKPAAGRGRGGRAPAQKKATAGRGRGRGKAVDAISLSSGKPDVCRSERVGCGRTGPQCGTSVCFAGGLDPMRTRGSTSMNAPFWCGVSFVDGRNRTWTCRVNRYPMFSWLHMKRLFRCQTRSEEQEMRTSLKILTTTARSRRTRQCGDLSLLSFIVSS